LRLNLRAMQDELNNKGSEPYKQKLKLAMSAFDSGYLIYSMIPVSGLPRENLWNLMKEWY
jgi:hypothetical protein